MLNSIKISCYVLLISFGLVVAYPSQEVSFSKSSNVTSPNEKLALNKLVQYLKIDTSHPNPKYPEAIDFLSAYSKELGLKFSVFECPEKKVPSAILTWQGTNSSLPSLVLNSHIDVVHAVKEAWKYDPFSPTITKDDSGKDAIFARGSQDSKSLGTMYLEAIRALKLKFPNGPKRTIHVTFISDEEIGGANGMKCFVESPRWSELIGPVDLVLDEGLFSEDSNTYVFASERFKRQFKVIARGTPGHGSLFIKDLASDKFASFALKIKSFRHQEERKFENGMFIGDVTTVNLNLISGGTAINIVPDKIEASFDMRVSPSTNLVKLDKDLKNWAKSSNVTIGYIGIDNPYTTDLSNSSTYKILQKQAEAFGMPLTLRVYSGASDSRFLRAKGINAIGMTPVTLHPSTAHAHNEFMRLESFYNGIKFYISALPSLAF